MAEFRYGREEMLALFDRSILPPDLLKPMQGLYVDKTQLPLALIQMTDEETRMWNRGINSDVALRLSKPGVGVGVGSGRGGRGGSVDRGRGRARGSYHYSRGLSYEEDTTNNRPHLRPYDRTQSGGGWGERNGGDLGDYMATSPRKEYGGGMRGGMADNWRKHRGAGEEDEGWRTARQDKWGRGSSNSWREGDNWDRSRGWDDTAPNSHPPPRKPWDSEENNLPEWAMENPSESGGSFDATGAFHGGSHLSDEEEKVESQSRPTPNHNISNGSSHPRLPVHMETSPGGSEAQVLPGGGGGGGPLRQSQSATCLPTERNHPLSSSASFSGVDSLTSQPPTPRDGRPESIRPVTTSTTSPPQHHPQPPPPEAPQPKPQQDEEIEQRLQDAAKSIVSRLVDEEEKEPPPPAVPSPPPAPTAQPDTFWFYKDPQGNDQGPFQSSEMFEWFSSGYFKGNLLVRRACDERYSPLSDMVKLWKGIPFISDYYLVPPIKNAEPMISSLPVLDDSLMIQFQLQQHAIMQRQAQALAKLTQAEHFNNLTLDQQQVMAHQTQAQMEMGLQAGLMAPHPHTPTPHTNSNVLAMLHQLAQYQQLQQQRGGSVPVPQTEPVDPLQQLMQQMGLPGHTRAATTPQNTPEDQRSIEQFMAAFRQRQANPQPPMPPPTMESVWGGGTTSPAFPAWSAPTGGQTASAPPPQSLWSDPLTKGIKTEKDILEEQLRAEEKKEEKRKQEELLRLKQEEEEKERERQRQIKEEEELERKRKEEEAERKRVQEEEERKKKEAAAAKKAEQDRLRKEEEKKRKEEEKRRKEEEKRKLEEEKKRAEEERKKLEEERKKKEEMTRRQNEALKRLQEQQQQQQQQQQQRASKATAAPWTSPPVPDPTVAASLADIQKIERKQQQQLREQQEMLKSYQEKHQKQLENSKSGSNLHLKWVETMSSQPARVKSLAEIQAEEHERMAKQAEKEKAERTAAAKEVPLVATGSIWAQQNLSWSNSQQNTASVWGTDPTVSNSVSARFWDEVSAKPSKPAKQQPSQQQQSTAKSQAKTKAKKEEASVMKLFEKQIPKTSKSEDFNKWCVKTLSSQAYEVDIPTFVDFLLAFESHKEIREYIRMYLGDGKEANDFATEFIDRRSRLLSDQPLQRPEPPAHTNTNQFQEVKGKNKKVKKSKMTKVDSRILGFNVTAAPDRINVGDRDYGEGL
ncbi:GIGYF family protein Gyf-like isoform X3 [Homalodisca vitripennis]|nr:GIGYF family protein Gyf-like isoform X3 [Homalodisca vitripennis]